MLYFLLLLGPVYESMACARLYRLSKSTPWQKLIKHFFNSSKNLCANLLPTALSMADTKPSSSSSSSTKWALIAFLILPVFLAVLVYQLDSFDPAAYPAQYLSQKEALFVPKRNDHMLQVAERIGGGKLLAPEDIAYDAKSGYIYTGCGDGWIRRVKLTDSVADSVVEDLVNTGGKPLGVVLGHHGEVIVADADKGLLNATADGEVHLLSNEAEGIKIKLADGVDIADDGIIYFTDGSYKYGFKEFIWELLEGRPYGRILSYDPTTKETKVLLSDLYFPNGLSLSPDQKSLIFCETPLRCCKKYYMEGEKKGSVEMFVENMPGMPDDIRYDGEGHYWIGVPTEITYLWDLAQRYPFVRKILAIVEKTIGRPHMETNSGVLAVDLDGKPLAYYHDHGLSYTSSGMKIGDYLYCGNAGLPDILRLNLTQLGGL